MRQSYYKPLIFMFVCWMSTPTLSAPRLNRVKERIQHAQVALNESRRKFSVLDTNDILKHFFPEQTPFEVRLAVAEFLNTNLVREGEFRDTNTKNLLEGIAFGRLQEKDVQLLTSFIPNIQTMIVSSRLIRQVKFMQDNSEQDLILGSTQDLIIQGKKTTESTPSGWFSKFPFFKKNKDAKKEQKGILYINAVSFAQRLVLEKNPKLRLEILRASFTNPLTGSALQISLKEAYYILTIWEPNLQPKAREILQPYLVGDFSTLGMEETIGFLTAGISGGTNYQYPLSKEIIIKDLESSSDQIDLPTLLEYLKTLGADQDKIVQLLKNSKIKLHSALEEIQVLEDEIPLNTARILFNGLSPRAKTLADLENLYLSLFEKTEKDGSEGYLTVDFRKISESPAFKVEYKVGMLLKKYSIQRQDPTETSIPQRATFDFFSDLKSLVYDLKNDGLKIEPTTSLFLLRLIPDSPFRPTAETLNLRADALLDFRNDMRDDRHKGEYHNPNPMRDNHGKIKSGFGYRLWTATDLYHMNLTLNLDLAREILSITTNASIDDLHAMYMSTELDRLILGAGLKMPNPPGRPTPGKENIKYLPENRGISVNALIKFLKSKIDEKKKK